MISELKSVFMLTDDERQAQFYIVPLRAEQQCRKSVYAASKCAVEGFTESLSYELNEFNIKVRLVEPGYAPTTNFSANGGARMQGLIPDDYSRFAQACFSRFGNYPTAFCTEAEVADAVYAAATDEQFKIRYPAGADTRLLADLRWSTSEEQYQRRMREMFGPN